MKPLPPLRMTPMPAIDLRHLFVLTDDTGILQHATRATPDLHHVTHSLFQRILKSDRVHPRSSRWPAGSGPCGHTHQALSTFR